MRKTQFSVTALLFCVLALPACDSTNGGIPVIVVDGEAVLLLGGQVQFTATTVNATETGYSWRSTNPVVASVDASGMVTGRAAGESMIIATGAVTGKQGMFPVVVSAEPSEGVPFLEQWSNSAHNRTDAEAFRHWDDDGEIPTSCAKCHSTHGYRDFLGADGSTPGVVDAPAALGSTVECIACHSEQAQKITSVAFPSGVSVPNSLADAPLGREAVCMNCHQGRSSADTVDAAIAAVGPANDDEILPDQGFINVHYFPAAATRYGGTVRGGYLYDGKSYDVLFRHVPGLSNCQDCHDPHTLEIRLDVCSNCHDVSTKEDLHNIRMASSATRDYDGDGNLVEGLWFEIQGLRTLLFQGIQAYAKDVIGTPIVYDGGSYPYLFVDTNANGIVDAGEASFGNRYKTYSSRLLKATYNYQYATKDPGGFAHNGKFIIQLLHDSIEDLNAALAAPIDMSAAVRTDRGHFDGTADAFRHWDDDTEVSASCARCHSASNGFDEFLTYKTNTEQPIANGFDCAVCHTTFNDFQTRRIESVEFPGGLSTPSLSGFQTDDPQVQSNMCITCHQGRESKKTIDDAIAASIAQNPPADPFKGLSFKNVHYLAAAATLFGTEAKVGYEYAGKMYLGKFPHVSSSPTNTNHCVFCHDPVKTKHTFLPQDNIDTCRVCHTASDGVSSLVDVRDIRLNRPIDYDGDGDNTERLKDEIDGMATRLLAAFQAYSATIPLRVSDGAGGTMLDPVKKAPVLYNPDRYPYFFNDTNGNGVADPGEIGFGNRYQSWDDKMLRAAHNYQHSQKEPGAWAHNMDYLAQLIYDAIEDLGGDLTGLVRPPS